MYSIHINDILRYYNEFTFCEGSNNALTVFKSFLLIL